MDKKELMNDVVYFMNDDDFVDLWNSYCGSDYRSGENIYYMCEFDDLMRSYSPVEILESVDDDFSTYDDYFSRDPYWECFSSFNDPLEKVDLDELIDYIIDNDDDFGFYDIRKMLDSEEFDLAS